jgi:flagellar protein FliT
MRKDTMTIPLIHYYQAIETTSKAMVDAALTENWDEVVRLEGACALLIEQLRENSLGMNLSAEERAEKHRIMMTILRHDAQIRELVDPWMDDTENLGYHVAPAQLH